MELHTAHRHGAFARSVLSTGFLIGLCGGLAEIILVWIYTATTSGTAESVAQGVAAAVSLGVSSAISGVAVHMGLSVLLGLALSAAWQALRGPQSSGAAAYAFMSAMLICIWSINFLVVLPLVSPAFLALLPLPVTFASKLMFALAGAPMLLRLDSVSDRRRFRPRGTDLRRLEA